MVSKYEVTKRLLDISFTLLQIMNNKKLLLIKSLRISWKTSENYTVENTFKKFLHCFNKKVSIPKLTHLRLRRKSTRFCPRFFTLFILFYYHKFEIMKFIIIYETIPTLVIFPNQYFLQYFIWYFFIFTSKLNRYFSLKTTS